jgi:heat shock protein HslJ
MMTKFRFYSFILIAILSFNVGILAKSKTQILVIADRMADCTGVAPMKCLQIKLPQDEKWTLFYGVIENFQYIAGYTYVVRVAVDTVKNPPADGSSKKYRLKKILSREKTSSDQMPTQATSNIYANAWQLTRIEGKEINTTKAYIEFNEKDARFGGNTGCNRMSGSFTKTDSSIKFSQIISTKMFCQDTSEVENAFTRNLEKAARFEIKDGKLYLFADETTVLEFTAKR